MKLFENITGKPIMLAGAHNGLSAKIVEECSFHGVWASGFEISASYCLPDANILSMNEVLNRVKEMVSAVKIPIIADCDNGFGNAVKVIKTVQGFEGVGVSGICIEDNVFPKRCSLYNGFRRRLESIEEFSEKIKVAVETKTNNNFMLIARTEALIAGLGMKEALKRAKAYEEAGADAVLIHSKQENPLEVIEFAEKWKGSIPLVAVPTTYSSISAKELYNKGFKIVIFANHAIRSSVKAMKNNLSELKKTGCISSIEAKIAPVEEVFSLTGLDDLLKKEKIYPTLKNTKMYGINHKKSG
ncbi:MAG: isocitrate lyase/phosphoenolpyruvate mutase family protein [archaeon]